MTILAETTPDIAPDESEQLAVAHRFCDDWLHRVLPSKEMLPRRLHEAMHDAVFPGGRRARPMLCRLIAEMYGHGDDELVGRMAAAVELVHCASLVQDDLPCFDNADTRRGLPAGHIQYGEATAILVGDALLTLAFETLSSAPHRHAALGFRLVGALSVASGSRHGVIGGQALELEDLPVDLAEYHRQKTAALFRAAALGAAICAGADAADELRWARFGELVGCALQLRDDVDDVTAESAELGKPSGRDQALGRPNAALQHGVASAREMREQNIAEAHALLGTRTPATAPLYQLLDEVTRPSRP